MVVSSEQGRMDYEIKIKKREKENKGQFKKMYTYKACAILNL